MYEKLISNCIRLAKALKQFKALISTIELYLQFKLKNIV